MTFTRRQLTQITALGTGAVAIGRSQTPSSSSRPTPGTAGNQDGLTLRVAEFVVNTGYEDIPSEVIELGRKSILDALGLALVGSVAESGQIAREYLKAQGFGSSGSTVIGSSLRAPTRFAAFANGVGIHADDYDDTQLAVSPDRVYGLLTHPTAPCFSAALAVAEATGMSGHSLMEAYQIGVEVECKVSEAINPRHYQEGFHSTGTCGTFAAAAASMKLRGADAHLCARALGLAASQSSGLRENFGTMTKPFHAGHAAESGIFASDLVTMGWTASEKILEAPSGFFRAAGGGFDPGALTLGKPWTIANPGVSIKPFPSGSLTHPGMTELRRMIRANKIEAGMVERLDVGTNKYMPTALIHHRPTDSLQAKFSMEFCMSSLLLYGRAGLNEFKDEVVRRPEVQAMIQRVNFHVHPVAEAAGYNKMTTILDLHLKDGRTIYGKADFALGSPADPMSFDDVAAKFDDGARFANWPAAKTAKIIESVRKFEQIGDIRTLTALLSA